jgi:hypothetical protein
MRDTEIVDNKCGPKLPIGTMQQMMFPEGCSIEDGPFYMELEERQRRRFDTPKTGCQNWRRGC